MTSQYTRVCSLLVLASVLFAGGLHAEDVAHEIDQLQQDWAAVNYATESRDAKLKLLEELSERAERLSAKHPQRAEPLVWEGIILSTYAGVKGGLGALGLAKKARATLETALELDAGALDGSAYTSLGALYYKVPGFPLGFGDHKKAVWYLHKALAMNPDGIDPNYFYADYLYEKGKYQEAREYLQRALRAPKRVGREAADEGRRREIALLLDKIDSKLS